MNKIIYKNAVFLLASEKFRTFTKIYYIYNRNGSNFLYISI